MLSLDGTAYSIHNHGHSYDSIWWGGGVLPQVKVYMGGIVEQSMCVNMRRAKPVQTIRIRIGFFVFCFTEVTFDFSLWSLDKRNVSTIYGTFKNETLLQLCHAVWVICFIYSARKCDYQIHL